MDILRMIKIFILLLAFAMIKPVDAQNTYFNPVLAGFYPDPSICRVGADFYLVNSTFAYFPGVPVFHSTDLLHWEQLGHVLDRTSQLNIENQNVSQGIFAPDISYHDGTFYMVTTNVHGGGNFVVTADKPEGPWSDPVWLPEVQGIDPSIFFDDDGKAYIVHNGEPPDNKPLYDGHRALWILEFDPVQLKITGERKLLVNGGTDINKNPIWIEGPHIFKHNGYYYLIAAEGGTSYNHSEVVFRSTNVFGPYESYKNNPILTQRNLDPGRDNPVTNTGHADIVQTENGEWWAVFLGCRPYEQNYFNTGRETFMAPVKWIDGWPVINPDSDIVLYEYPRPKLETNDLEDFPKNGNFTLNDEFNDEELADYWIFLRTPKEKWYHLKEGKLELALHPEMITKKESSVCIFRRQQHTNCVVSALLEFKPGSDNEVAGILAFQNEQHFYLLGKTMHKGKDAVALFSGNEKSDTIMDTLIIRDINTPNNLIYLKIEIKGADCTFYYSTDNTTWEFLSRADAKILSTEVAGGFVGTMLGIYASSNNQPSDNDVKIHWFNYEGDDVIYK